jgi:hypothetical protein
MKSLLLFLIFVFYEKKCGSITHCCVLPEKSIHCFYSLISFPGVPFLISFCHEEKKNFGHLIFFYELKQIYSIKIIRYGKK